MKKFLCTAVVAAALVAAANAGGLETAKAALDQLNNAEFSKAADGFSLAIDAGDLSDADLEFAYYNRGIAELWQRDYQDAVSDFSISVHMAPDDENAQDYLDFAKEYLDHAPPDMPVSLNGAVNSLVGSLFSPLLKGGAAKQWLTVSPLMQHCLAFKYGMEPIKLASRSIIPSGDLIDPYIEKCQKLIDEE